MIRRLEIMKRKWKIEVGDGKKRRSDIEKNVQKHKMAESDGRRQRNDIKNGMKERSEGKWWRRKRRHM